MLGPETVALIAAGLAAISGFVGKVLGQRSNDAKNYSDSAIALSSAYGMLLDRHNDDLKRLDKNISDMRIERAALLLELATSRDENQMLRSEVQSLRDEVEALKSQ